MAYTDKTKQERANRRSLQAKHLREFLEKELDDDTWLLHVITGCSLKTIEGWLKGERVMDSMAAFRIHSVFPEYNSWWIEGRAEENEQDAFALRKLMQPINETEKHDSALRNYCIARVEWLKTHRRADESRPAAR